MLSYNTLAIVTTVTFTQRSCIKPKAGGWLWGGDNPSFAHSKYL